MKATFSDQLAVALAASCLCLGGLSAQTVTYEAGDLLIGFQATGGTGASESFVYNAGSTIEFRDGRTGLVANVGEVLVDLYGQDWFDRTDVRWGAVGVRDNRDPRPALGTVPPVVSGDPSATLYVSRLASGVEASIPWTGLVKGAVISAATTIRGLADLGQVASGCFALQAAAPGTDNRGVIVGSEKENSWAFYNPALGASFSIFTGGIEGTFGADGDRNYLDLYRILAHAEGADPAGVAGEGSWVTTLTIDRQGNIHSIHEESVEPPPPGYWYENRSDITVHDNGWWELPWFGYFLPFEDWVFHLEHGWMVVYAQPSDSYFVWDAGIATWFWTTNVYYPWLYKFGFAEGWYLFLAGTFAPDRQFYAADDGGVYGEEALVEAM